jgi:hypothetical protein
MIMKPGTLLLSTPGCVPHSGQRSAPPAENALPNMLIPTYPSSTLNYYQQSTSFISHDQDMHTVYLHQYPHLHCFL